MSLAAPLWLLAASLAGIVFLLHSRRRRVVAIPSLQIWARLDSSRAMRRRLQWPPISLVLLLQVLAIVLAALALADPRLRPPVAVDHTIFVLDGSASMRARDAGIERFEAARNELARHINTDGLGRISVVLATGNPELVAARLGDPRAVVPLLRNLAAGDGEADWRATATTAQIALRAGETARFIVLSDDPAGATGGLRAILPESVAVETISFAAAGSGNAGMNLTLAPRPEGTNRWQVGGTIVLPQPAEAVSISVRFQPDNGAGFLDWGTIEVPRPEGDATPRAGVPDIRSVDAELELPGAGVVVFRLADDSGRQAFGVTAPRPIRILLLGHVPPEVQRAFQAVEGTELLVADEMPADDETYDLIVASDIALPRQPRTNVLWLARAGLADAPPPLPLAGTGISGWSNEHPLARDIDWTKLVFPVAFDVPLLPGSEVLASSGSAALITARTTRSGREVRIAALLEGSSWTTDPGFPLFFANLVAWLGVPAGPAAMACIADEPCPIEPRLLGGTIVDETGAIVWQAAGADVLLAGVENTFVPPRAGLYTLAVNGAATILAVSPPAAGETPADLAGSPNTGNQVEFRPGFRLWVWLLDVVVIVLIAEAWVAGRGAEGFLRRWGLAAKAPRAQRLRFVLLLRGLAIALVVAALFELPRPSREPTSAVVVVAGADLGPTDRTAGRAAVLDSIDAARSASGAGAIGWVRLGGATAAAVDFGAAGPDITLAPAAPGANLEEALRLAAAMLPGNRRGRIVLAADGNETAGAVAAAMPAITPRGIAVDVVQLNDMPPTEVLVETVSVPDAVRSGDRLPVTAIVLAAAATRAHVVILEDGSPSLEQDVDLVQGRNRIEGVVTAGPEGERLIEVVVTSADDVQPANNRFGLIVSIGPVPSVLLVVSEPDAGEIFADALAVQGINATIVEPNRAPYYLRDWLLFDTVVLMNVPAIALTTLQQDLLEEAVTVHGLGLLILGGENAFGPGGYYATPLETLSPLSSRVPHDSPVVAMAFVLDRSGSMRAMVGEGTRLDIAKAATRSAVAILDAMSEVAVVVFDTEAHTIVPLQTPKNDAAVEAALAPIEPGGGTAVYPAIAAAFAELQRSDAEAKHMVVMTDGLVEEVDFAPLFSQIRAAGITVSVVSVGLAADASRLAPNAARLAPIIALGGGAYHETTDFRALPGILAQEALLLANDPIVNAVTPVFWADRNDGFLANMPDVLPPLRNYVATSQQPGATVNLAVIGEDGEPVPVLASWRRGAGQVLAFGSHGAGSGTQDWLGLTAYPLLWSQAVRQFAKASRADLLDLEIQRTGDTLSAVAHLRDRDANPVTAETVTVRSIPDGAPIALMETAPGRYEGVLATVEPGVLRFTAMAGTAEASAAFVVSYPARLSFGRAATEKLATIAAATGGAILVSGEIVAPTQGWFTRPDWRFWAALFLLVLVAELTIRYARLPSAPRIIARALPAAARVGNAPWLP